MTRLLCDVMFYVRWEILHCSERGHWEEVPHGEERGLPPTRPVPACRFRRGILPRVWREYMYHFDAVIYQHLLFIFILLNAELLLQEDWLLR